MTQAHLLQAAVLGAGVLGPGVAGWNAWRAIARGEAGWQAAPTVLPAPAMLPAAERRRASRVVKAALSAGTQAIAQAGLDAATLPVVFASSGGDGHNCHALCELLAGEDKQISPTRFHNSVHNAASGYWSIAARAMAPAQVVAAYDGSFAMGLFEAMSQVQYGGVPVLLISCDSEYPEPLHAKRPIADVSAIALVLAPVASLSPDAGGTQALLTMDATQAWSAQPASDLPAGLPETLRAMPAQLPPWRGLGVLAALAQGGPQPQALRLHVDEAQSLRVVVQGELAAVAEPADPA